MVRFPSALPDEPFGESWKANEEYLLSAEQRLTALIPFEEELLLLETQLVNGPSAALDWSSSEFTGNGDSDGEKPRRRKTGRRSDTDAKEDLKMDETSKATADEAKEIKTLEEKPPELDRENAQWVKNKRAAKLDGLETGTLRRYRQDGIKNAESTTDDLPTNWNGSSFLGILSYTSIDPLAVAALTMANGLLANRVITSDGTINECV